MLDRVTESGLSLAVFEMVKLLDEDEDEEDEVAGGGLDFDPPPSASGDVAPEFFLEGPSRAETETESRDEEEVEPQAQPKKKRTRGEAGVPRKEPETQEVKALIIPDSNE